MMRKQEALQLVAYCGVAILSVGAAFIVSMQFMGASRAQDGEAPPPAQEAPAAPGPESNDIPQSPPPPGTQPREDLGGVQPSPGATVDTTTAQEVGGGGSGIAEIEGFLEPYIYDVVNRRDPFLAYAEFVPNDEGPARPMSPAQRFAIEDLRLVGVMWDVKDPKALFQDPEAEILTLGRDDSIGNRNGYIAAIREGEVVVVEAIRKKGDIIYRTKVLRIER